MTTESHARWAKPTLTGTLVTLRPLDEGDFDDVWEMLHDPEGNDLTATSASFAIEQVQDWCATRPSAPERLDLAIIEHATGEFAGEAVLNEYDAATNSANFRIALRGPRWYGRHLGTEATTLIVEHGLTTVGLDAVRLTVLARNPRARRAYVKAGFVDVEEFDEDGERWVTMEIRRRPV